MTALHYASVRGNNAVCELLLSRGANPNVQDDAFGSTPLHFAAIEGHATRAHLNQQRRKLRGNDDVR